MDLNSHVYNEDLLSCRYEDRDTCSPENDNSMVLQLYVNTLKHQPHVEYDNIPPKLLTFCFFFGDEIVYWVNNLD